MAALEELNYLAGGIHLFGDQRVRKTLRRVVFKLGLVRIRLFLIRMEAPEGSTYQQIFREAYDEHRREMIKVTYQLTEAMREDVTREILD